MHALRPVGHARGGRRGGDHPAETIPADKDVLALVIRVTEAPALNCWSCSMYEWMKLQGSRVHEMEMNMIDYSTSTSTRMKSASTA